MVPKERFCVPLKRLWRGLCATNDNKQVNVTPFVATADGIEMGDFHIWRKTKLHQIFFQEFLTYHQYPLVLR
jgi:hypothetical protein